MLLDSNIIIYAVENDNPELLDLVHDSESSTSIVSYVEVLGYTNLNEENKQTFERIFATIRIFPLNFAIADRAIALRQQRRMGLGDSIIAATALLHNQTLVTRNTRDFRRIVNLRLLNPMEEQEQNPTTET